MTRAINGDHWSIDVEYRGTVQNPVVSVNLPALSVHLSVPEMDAIASKWIAYRNKISEGIFAEPEDLGTFRHTL